MFYKGDSFSQNVDCVLWTNLVHHQLDKSVSEGFREVFTTTVARWILGREYSEILMRFQMFLGLRQEQLSVVVKKSVKTFENLTPGEIEFIQDEPITISNCLDQDTLPK